MAELQSRIAANFVGWEKDHALFDREPEKVITNDPKRLGDSEYIPRLLGQVVTVSLETVKVAKEFANAVMGK